MEIILDIIHGSKTHHDFMKAVDVFEEGKFLGEHETIQITGMPNLFTLAETLKDAYEHAGRLVTFIGLKFIDGKPISNGVHYLKPGVRTISNGKQWGLLCHMLETLGYLVETDNLRFVTSVLSSD